ncbi:MAG: DUF6732 family protein [Cohaesibacteraceae bacterium]
MKVRPPLLLAAMILAPSAAQAHPGHVSEASGHSHWIAVAALAAIALVGAWSLVRKLSQKKTDQREIAAAQTNAGDQEPA